MTLTFSSRESGILFARPFYATPPPLSDSLAKKLEAVLLRNYDDGSVKRAILKFFENYRNAPIAYRANERHKALKHTLLPILTCALCEANPFLPDQNISKHLIWGTLAPENSFFSKEALKKAKAIQEVHQILTKEFLSLYQLFMKSSAATVDDIFMWAKRLVSKHRSSRRKRNYRVRQGMKQQKDMHPLEPLYLTALCKLTRKPEFLLKTRADQFTEREIQKVWKQTKTMDVPQLSEDTIIKKHLRVWIVEAQKQNLTRNQQHAKNKKTRRARRQGGKPKRLPTPSVD